MSNPTAKSLYNALINKGYTSANIGDEETFVSAMADKANRRELFDMVVNDGYDLGDYDAFEGRFTPQPTKVEQPAVEQPMAQVSEPMVSDTIQPVQPIQSPKAKLVDNPDDYYPTLEQNTRKDVEVLSGDIDVLLNEAKGASARKYAEQTTEAAKGGFWKAIQNAMVNTAGAVELADAQAQTPQKIWGGGIDRDAEKEINDYKAAEHALENARRTINEADINAKNGTLREKMESTFVGGMYRGFGQKLFDARTWDMGVSDFKDQSAINDALDAAENGTLTESQEALLNAKAQEMAVQAYFGSYVGRGYKAGSVTAESLPFMLEMCINPASTIGKSVSSRLARWALKKFGTKTAETVGRVVGRALGDVAAASAMTATTGSIRTAADAMERMSGGVAFDTDEQGHAVFDGRYETPEDVGTAIKKAFAAQTIQYGSEMLGHYFAPALNIISKPFGKIPLGRVQKFLDDVSASDFGRLVTDFQKRAQWNGNLGEFAEEMSDGVLNALIVGDQTLDTDPETGVFNRDNLIDTYLGVNLLGFSMSSIKTVGYGVEKYQQKRAVKRADVAAADAFGSVDEWDKIKTEVDAASNEELPVLLGNIMSNPDVTDDQKTALMVYVGAKQREKGAVIGEQKRRENPDVPQEQVEIEQSFDNGAALETPQEKNDAQNMFEYQQQQMRQYFGLGEDGDVDAFLGDDPIAGLQRVAANDQEAGQVVLDYLNAKATVDGVFQRMSDDAEAKIAEADAIIASRTNRNNGMIQRVRLKNDKQAYVLSGDIVMTDDGDMVNVSKSSESLVVIDAITGKKEYTYPSNIAEVYQSVDAETERQTLRDQVIDEYSQKLADDMNGTLAFAPGDNYTLVDDQGTQHNVQIVADNGDGTVAVVEVMPDGVQQEAVMAKSTIQEMSDTHNQLRLGQYLQDKKAQEIAIAEQEAQAEQPEVVAEEQQQQPVSALSQVPKDKKGKHDFNQVSPDIAWNAIVEMTGGAVDDALDTAKQMQKQSNDALKAAQKEKPKVGTDVESIIANKNAHKEKISGLQAIADHWANIVALGEQSAQQNEQTEEVVAENVVAEGAAPVAEQIEVSPEVAPVAEEVVEPTTEEQAVEQSEISNEPTENNADFIGRSLTSDEAKTVILAMQQNAEQVELMELTPENWIAQFGEDGILATPIGDVKMGENQYFKLAKKGRDGKLGMIKPTLLTPDVIIEEKSTAKDGQVTERDSSYVFVKAFTNDDGSRNYLFTSVTVRKEGKEVVISNQEKETPRIERLLKEGKLAYISKATLPSEPTNSTQGNQSTILGGAILSESKDTTTEPITQEIEQENLQPTPENVAEEQMEVATEQPKSETVEPTPRGAVDMDTLQLTMSDEEFNSLLDSGDVERMNGYLKELDDTLVINDQSPFKGQQELREEFKRLKDQYGGEDNIPADVMEDINARYTPYAELSRKVYDRKYALEDKLRTLDVQQQQVQKEQKKEMDAEHKATAFNGFLANKTALGASSAEKALSKKVKIEDKNYTIAEYVEQAVQSGKIELRTSEVPKYKGVSRRKWNQMDAAQQQAEQERIKNGGTVTEYYINDYNLGKTAYDYAQYLQAKAEAQKAAEPEWLQKVPTDGRNFMVYTKVAGENNYSATDLKTGQAVGLVYASLVKRDRLQSLVEELPKVLLEGAHFQIRDTNGKIYYSSEPIETTKGKKKATTKLTTLKTVSGAEVKVPINLYKYVSTDKTRAYTGVYFDPEGFVVATDGHNMIAVKHDVAEADAEKFISKAGDVASMIFNWRIASPKPNTEKPMNVDFVDVEKQIGGKAGDKFVVFEIDGQEVGFPPKAIHVLADFQRAFGGQAFVGDMTAGKAIVIRSGDNYAIALQTTKYADLSQAVRIPIEIEQTAEQAEQPTTESKEQAPQPSEPTKQEPKPKRTADRKIEDYGEKIAGARKDILRNMSKNFDNATIESLVALPFAKAFVKPDLKKLVEAGVLRPDDAKYAEAIMWVYINKNKPKARKTDVWAAKRGRETRITAWAQKTFDGITRLRDFIEADEATRDELIAQYGQLGEQIKANEDIDRVRLNRLNGGALVFGDLYSPNPIEVIVATLDKLNYQAGDKITFDAPIVKAEYLGRFYNFENQDGEKVYAFNRADSIEEAIDTLVLQAKIRRGDTDIQYPTYMFSITREDPIREPSGMFTVFHINKRGSLIPETVEGREAAEKKVAEYQSQGLSADLREEKKIVGYATHRIRFKNRLTDVETIFDEKFGSEGDARQALEERYDEFNDLANDYVASLSKQKREQPVPFEVTTSWNSEIKAVKYVVKNTETGDVMSPQLDTRKEAEEYYKNHIEEWKAKWQEMKDARKKFVFFDDNVKPREGKDYRNGRDVTAEDLATTFGFRGIQFGNWTNDADRQAALNQAYDAFMDLADILGVSPKALSLAGELGIAFGARGGGSALAHYEPDEIVINLTKTKGAGSLAHEWWHALDNYFSRQGNIPMGFVTSNPTEAKMREEMRAAWQGVVKAVKGTEYAKRSMAQGDYWGRMLEMTARLFGEWTVYELAKTGRTNHFLSRGITPGRFDMWRRINYAAYKWSLPEDQTPMPFEEFTLLPRSLKGMPFPTKEETEQMGEAVRNLFDVVQEKVDEQGNVVLFQRGDFPEMPNTEANRRAYNLVREKLQKIGIKVHEVSEEMADAMASLTGAQFAAKRKSAPETASVQQEHQPTVVSSADGAKILKDLDSAITEYENKSSHPKTLLGDIAKVLNAKKRGSNSQYATFEAVNGKVFTIRLANHNAKTSTFDNHNEDEGISIVVTAQDNTGITNNGNAHLVEFFYDAIKLRKADGKPLVEILKSIKQALYSGEYVDTTGLAEREEVNLSDAEYQIVYHGSGAKFDRVELFQDSQGKIYGWAVGGEIYLTPDGLNANTAIHEYSHLWVEAMRKKDPRKWSNIKEQLKATPFWQQVLDDPNYANIHENEDAVASEVLARLTGKNGAERLANEAQRIIDAGNGNLMARVESSALVQHVKRLLRDFYAWVSRNIFGVTNEATISQFSDMVVDDLLDEVALDNIEESPYEAMVGNKQEDTDDNMRFRVTPAMDKAYMDAVERGDMETAQRMVDEAAEKAGYNEKVYHGTQFFGFTKFGSQRPSGAIFTSDKRNVAANYGGGNRYASVRRINQGYKGGRTSEEVISDARSVFDQEWRMVNDEERSVVIDKIEADAKRVMQKMNSLQIDVPTEIQENVAWVENIIYTTAEGRENGNNGDEMQRMLLDDYEQFVENRSALREWLGDHRSELTMQQQQYLDYLIGYEVFDVAVDAGHSFANAFSSDEMATVDGLHFVPIRKLWEETRKAANVGSYELYGNLGDRPLIINGEGKAWYGLDFNGMRSTDDIVEWAKQEGYTSVVFNNISDNGDPSDVKVFFNPEQVKSADPVTYDDNGNVIPLSQRFNSRESDIRFRSSDRAEVIANFDADFAELDSEYQQIDKNDEQAMAKWRSKKKQVVEDYLNYMTDEYALPGSVFVFDHNDADSLDEAAKLMIEVVAEQEGISVNEIDPSEMKECLDYARNEFATSGTVGKMMRGRGVYNIGRAINENTSKYWLHVLLHENTHYLSEQHANAKDFEDIWAEAENNPTEKSQLIKERYSDKGAAVMGNEVVAYAVGDYAKSKHSQTLMAFIEGDERISLDDIVKKLNKSLPLRNELVIEVLNKLRDEYQRQETEVNTDRGDQEANREREAARKGQESGERSSRQDSQATGQPRRDLNAIATAAEELAGQLHTPIRVIRDVKEITDDNRTTQARKRAAKGWYDINSDEVIVILPNAESEQDVIETVLHEAVAHRGLRNVVGKEAFDTFLDNVFHNANPETRAKIVNIASRNGWEFRLATEEYIASLAERGFNERENRGFWEMVRDFFRDMLSKAKIALGFNINDNDLRYMLWRSYQMQKSKGAMAVAEDVDMQRKLGVGNFRTRQASVEQINAEFNKQLDSLTEENAREVILNVGMPSSLLRDYGVEDKPIRLYGAKLLSKIRKHGYQINDIKNLPLALRSPIAIFKGSEAGSFAILTELRIGDNNVLVTLSVGKGGHDVDFNIISSVYGKRGDSVARWINNEKLLYVNKEKALDYLSVSAPIAEAQNNQELDSATKIVEEFDNSKYKASKNMPDNIRFREGSDMIADDIDYDAGSMTFEESITNGLIKIAQERKDNAELKMNAIRAIGGNLSKLRKAMTAQRKYDQAMVDSIIRIAKMAMNSGFFTDMSRAEVSRLLTLVNKAASSRDITNQARDVVDMLIKHQVKEAKTVFEKLLKVRGAKVDSRGIIVQGKLDSDGQRMVAAFKEGIKLDPDTLQERIDQVLDEMGSDDSTIAANASVKYQGLMLAQQYVNEIRQSEIEEAEIKRELQEVTEAKILERDDYAEFVESVEDAIRENRLERIEAYNRMIIAMGEGMNYSIARAKKWREEQKERVQQIHHDANSDLQGVPTDEHSQLTWKQKIANNGLLRFAMQPLATFDQMLRFFGSKDVDGRGYLWNRFMSGFTAATDKEWKNKQAAQNELSEKLSKIMGKKMRITDVFSMMRKMPTVSVQFWDSDARDNSKREDKDKKTYELTQGNLLYIYMVNKMSDGRMKLRKMGISEQDVANITKLIDPRFIEFADWLQNDYLVRKRNEYNEVHQRMFGASMAAIENYFPLVINSRSRNVAEKIEEQKDDNARPSTITGSIIKRVRNSVALDLTNADAFAVILDHVDQMERWAAFAEFNRDLNALLSYKRFRNRVLNMSSARFGAGTTLWKNFKDTCAIAAGVYRPKGGSAIDATVLNIAKGVTASKIAFRLWTAVKQVLSVPAFATEANTWEFIKAFNPTNMADSWNWAIEELPTFAKRWQSRQAGDSRLRKTDLDWGFTHTKILETATRIGMSPNAFIDALACVVGAKAIYETKYKRYLKQGYNEAQAKQKALVDASVAFNETQQSSEDAYLSAMQVDRTVASVALSVFRNSNMAYTRRIMHALSNLKRRLKEGYNEESIAFMAKQMMREGGLTETQANANATKAYNQQGYKDIADVVLFGIGLKLMWELGSYLPYLIMGDDDEKKKQIVEDALVRSIAGPIEGLAGGDIVADAIGWKLSGKGFYGYSFGSLPLMDDIQNTLSKFDSDKVAAINDVLNILVASTTGVNPQTLTDTAVAIIDAVDADPATSKEVAMLIMRIMQVPQSQIDEIYIDELGVNAREARDLNPDTLAHRYAEYKRKKAAPITGIFYDKEGKEKADKKYVKRFNKMRKERIENAGDPHARKVIEEYENDEFLDTEALSKEINAQRKESESEYFNRYNRFRVTPEYNRYQTYKQKQKEINKAIKEFDWHRVDQLRTALADELSKSYALQTNEDASK